MINMKNNLKLLKCALPQLFLFYSVLISAQDTIPFILEEDNRIYLKVSVNQSDTLRFVFDLGANTTVINKTRLKKNKINIKFDSIVSNQGTNGISEEEISTVNSVSILGKVYNDIEILGISYPENATLDGVIGWNFFEDRKLRINYETNEITVYDELPKSLKGYNERKLKFIEGVPFIEVIVFKDKKKVKIWSMLDTGYNGELLIYYPEVKENDLLNQFQVIGEATTSGTDGAVSKSDFVLLPEFELGGFKIYNLPAYLTKTKFESILPSIMGGNILKRFHVILDFENELVFLKPNSKINSSF